MNLARRRYFAALCASRLVARTEARMAYVRKLRAEMDIRYRDYKKFQTDSRVLESN